MPIGTVMTVFGSTMAVTSLFMHPLLPQEDHTYELTIPVVIFAAIASAGMVAGVPMMAVGGAPAVAEGVERESEAARAIDRRGHRASRDAAMASDPWSWNLCR